MIYLIATEDDKYCKIGYSDNPIKRLITIQTGNPQKCRIVKILNANIIKESTLHLKFKRYRLNGEWFTYNKDILDYFIELESQTSHFNSVKINPKELGKYHDFFFKLDRVGQFNLLGYALATCNPNNFKWEVNDTTHKACDISKGTLSSYIKKLVSVGLLKRDALNSFTINAPFFKVKPLIN